MSTLYQITQLVSDLAQGLASETIVAYLPVQCMCEMLVLLSRAMLCYRLY